MSWFKKSLRALPGLIGNFYERIVKLGYTYNDFVNVLASLLRVLGLEGSSGANGFYFDSGTVIKPSSVILGVMDDCTGYCVKVATQSSILLLDDSLLLSLHILNLFYLNLFNFNYCCLISRIHLFLHLNLFYCFYFLYLSRN